MLRRLVKYPDLDAVFVKSWARPRRCRWPFPLPLFRNRLLKKITLITWLVQKVVIIHYTSYFSFVGITVMSVNQTRVAHVLFLVAVIENSGAARRGLIVIINSRRNLFITYHLSRGIEFFWVILNIPSVMNLELTLRELLCLTTSSLTDL